MSLKDSDSASIARKEIAILIADDHPVYRDGLAQALASHDDIRVVAQTGDGDEALHLIQDLQPDVALVDLRLPSRDGISIVEAVKKSEVRTRTMIVSAFEDASTMYQAYDAGARAYVTKHASPSVLYDVIVSVSCGQIVFPESVRSGLSETDRLHRARTASTGALSARQREVLVLISQGRSAPEIAEELFLSVTTVKTHLQHIYDKLGASDRAAAVAVAARRGLLD